MSEQKSAGDLHVGDSIHGFANGFFGRDSYACRVIEEEGRDWFVTRNTRGEVELITRQDAAEINDPYDLGYCDGTCGMPTTSPTEEADGD